MLFITIRAVIYVTAFILLFGWLSLSVRSFDRDIGIVLPNWTTGLGIILMVAGGLLVLMCAAVFVARGRGTPAVFDPPREFVALGPYKFVRNPMYIGGFMLQLGFGLYHRSPSILLLSLLLILLLHLFVVFIEEPGLEERFGQGYLDYKKAVNRWIPKSRPSVS
ncbi:MAG: methyltransferase family protein [Pyrinomonadaceae bacterium]